MIADWLDDVVVVEDCPPVLTSATRRTNILVLLFVVDVDVLVTSTSSMRLFLPWRTRFFSSAFVTELAALALPDVVA